VFYRDDLKKLFVIDGGLGRINIYDSSSYAAIGSILRKGAGPMAYDSGSKLLYVVTGGRDGNMPESYLDVIDTTSGKRMSETAILVPELDRYYIAVPRHGTQVAELRAFRMIC